MTLQQISLDVERPAHAVRAFHTTIGKRFEVHAAGDAADLTLYDEIGFWGVTASQFKRALDGISAKTINLRINSPGGDVFDGVAIYNDLLAHPATVNVEISGMAASAASLIAMAGDSIGIADNAFMMIHNAWTIALGDHNDFAAIAEVLGKINDALARTYAARTGIGQAEVQDMMDQETWMSGPEAVDLGFADQVTATEEEQAAASALFDLSHFRAVPSALKRRLEAGLHDAGYSRQDAKRAVAKGFEILPQREVVAGPGRREAESVDADLLESVEALVRTIKAAASGSASHVD